MSSENSIKTKFGNLFYLCAGFEGDPLILILHGSGPNNSSNQYNFFLFEYLARICYIRRYFIVAIDCPGYGKSEGSKQIVRSYPLELIQEIFQALNYKKAFALFGHSQGGASIFNAVYINNNITDILIMDRPVCGDIKRFHNFKIPCLLVYDIEDDGHPISQGKLLSKNIKFNRFHTYRTSKEPFWITDNLWDVLLDFILEFEEGFNKMIRSKSQTNFCKSERLNNFEFENENKKNKNNFSLERNTFKEEKEIKIFREENKKIRKKKNFFEDKIEKKPEKKNNSHIIEKIKLQSQDKKLIEITEDFNSSNIIEEKKYESQKQLIASKINMKEEENNKENNETLEENYICGLCLNLYYIPIKLSCSHNFCLSCLKDLLIYENKCPLCRALFNFSSDPTEVQSNKLLMEEMKKKIPAKKLQERLELYLKDDQNKLKKKRVIFAYGHEFIEIKTKARVNNKQPVPKKYEWKIFVKQINYLKQKFIKSVEFDINYGVIGSKPIKVEKDPFILEGKGSFLFTPHIKISWENNLKLDKYETFHRVTFEDNNNVKRFMININ